MLLDLLAAIVVREEKPSPVLSVHYLKQAPESKLLILDKKKQHRYNVVVALAIGQLKVLVTVRFDDVLEFLRIRCERLARLLKD